MQGATVQLDLTQAAYERLNAEAEKAGKTLSQHVSDKLNGSDKFDDDREPAKPHGTSVQPGGQNRPVAHGADESSSAAKKADS